MWHPPVRPQTGGGVPKPQPKPVASARPDLTSRRLADGRAFPPPGPVPPPPPPKAQDLLAPPAGLRRLFDRVKVDPGVRAGDDDRERAYQGLPPAPTLTVREYANARRNPDAVDPDAADPAARAAETLLWQPVLVTPADGKATLSFDLADGVAGYQVLVAGHTLDGRLGASVTTIEARKPFAADFKLPPEIGTADRLTVPVTLTNATSQPISATLSASATNLAAGLPAAPTAVPPNGGGRALVALTPTAGEGMAELTVTACDPADPTLTHTARRTTTVVPDGFPVQGGASGVLAKSVELPLSLPKAWTPGTLHASVVVYPNALAEVQGGLDGLLREPAGCFEQTSSANYPNVLVLNLLRETGQAAPDSSTRAKGLLERGYARLAGFECPQTAKGSGGGKVGFEWFGTADRPHDALTAYGLVQFTDMACVYPVDAALLARTKQFPPGRPRRPGRLPRAARHPPRLRPRPGLDGRRLRHLGDHAGRGRVGRPAEATCRRNSTPCSRRPRPPKVRRPATRSSSHSRRVRCWPAGGRTTASSYCKPSPDSKSRPANSAAARRA